MCSCIRNDELPSHRPSADPGYFELRSGDPSGEFYVTSRPVRKLYIPEVIKRVHLLEILCIVRVGKLLDAESY
ncbi:hypothetical protein AVEN_227029-1 [Araneus ventricosus]|uniref:Uncharacterized protein n=1 Tax=Araneus ventricosus TaxID=182803 RepID=A0A4Y2M621_ARAVE|nr:hypothetical protein AVEN_227029-1 [Araneus ventricosus]